MAYSARVRVKKIGINNCKSYIFFNFEDTITIKEKEYGIAYKEDASGLISVETQQEFNFTINDKIFNFIYSNLSERILIEFNVENGKYIIKGAEISYV